MELSAIAGSLQSPPQFPLMDGSTSSERVYADAAGVWNGVMANLQLTTSVSPAINQGAEDGINKAYVGKANWRAQKGNAFILFTKYAWSRRLVRWR